jgi:hypothetical protein
MLTTCAKLLVARPSARHGSSLVRGAVVPHGQVHEAKTRLPVFLSAEYLEACDEQPTELTQKLLVIEPRDVLVFAERYVLAGRAHLPYLPRPYLTTFREYLVHPATRAWLHAIIFTTEQETIAARMIRQGTPLSMSDFNEMYTFKSLYRTKTRMMNVSASV